MTKEERIEAERIRLREMYELQAEIAGNAAVVFGIDEAGRGPLCGPVVAGCCVLPENADILWLNDSKKISEKKRELIYDEIMAKAIAYGIGIASPQRIDEINILNATYEAMQEAYEKCLEMLKSLGNKADCGCKDSAGGTNALNSDEPEASKVKQTAFNSCSVDESVVLVDGNKTVPGIVCRQVSVVKGDAKCPSISAASILAKVTRDRLMIEYDRLHPEYGIAKHKGYGTKEHVEAIRRYGITDIYRRTFLKNILN